MDQITSTPASRSATEAKRVHVCSRTAVVP